MTPFLGEGAPCLFRCGKFGTKQKTPRRFLVGDGVVNLEVPPDMFQGSSLAGCFFCHVLAAVKF